MTKQEFMDQALLRITAALVHNASGGEAPSCERIILRAWGLAEALTNKRTRHKQDLAKHKEE